MILYFIYVVLALTMLAFSADFFVKGASSLAKRFRISDITIGCTIVAIGTSAPEMVINAFAAARGEGDIVISNIVGSNIVNICLGLGLAAQLITITGTRRLNRFDIPLGVLGAVLLLVGLWPDPHHPKLPMWLVFLLLPIFIYYLNDSRKNDEADSEEEEFHILGPLRTAAMIILGGVGISFFGHMVVKYAVLLAEGLGVPSAVVGATIVAAGGSLPEVAACLAAARHRRPFIALGNVAGSQIFNLFGVLGVSLMISEPEFSASIYVDIGVLLFVSALLVIFLRRQAGITRRAGLLLISTYGLYLTYLAWVALAK